MSNELAQTLVRTGAIPRDRVDESIQHQVVHGGGLDTNILELGFLDETKLQGLLADAYGLPAVGKAEIDRIPKHVPKLFPLVFAETYHIVPLSLRDETLLVLTHTKPDPDLFQKITTRLEMNVEACITSELRLHYAMCRLYGTSLLPRMVALLEAIDGEAPEAARSGERPLTWGVSTRKIGQKPQTPGRSPEVGSYLGRLGEAGNRDTVVDILLESALTTFQFAGIFLVQNDRALGWRSTTPEDTQRLTQVTIPMDTPSVFRTIMETRGHYLGPLPGQDIHRHFVDGLGRGLPRTAFLAPITVGNKLAAILYADNGPTGVPSKRVASILVLTHRAGVVLESMIRDQRARATGDADIQVRTQPVPGQEDTVELDITDVEIVSDEILERAPEHPPQLPERSMDDEEWDSVSFEDFDPGAIQGPFGGENDPREDGAVLESSVQEVVELEVEISGDEVEVDDNYVAFADVTETPEDSVDDWEDVLVDTVSEPGKAERDHQVDASPQKPSVTWEQVAELALNPPELSVSQAVQEVEVAGSVVNEKEMLLDSLNAKDHEVRRGAIERLVHLGGVVDEDLHRRFPGETTFDPFAEDARMPPFPQCSGLCALLQARGASAAGLVAPHLDSDDAGKRFFAIYFFRTVVFPPALDALARRLLDREPRVRFMAADALRRYAHEPGYRELVEALREQLKVPLVNTQVSVAEVLGHLREPAGVPSLIPMLKGDGPTVQAAASALTVICAQAHGRDIGKWSEWWRDNYAQPREAWLVHSLRHEHPGIRALAFRELQFLTGMAQDVDPRTEGEAHEQAVEAWEAWWERAGAHEQAASA